MSQIAPATLEGWYALHQVFSTDWTALRAADAGRRLDVGEAACNVFNAIAHGPNGGWSAAFRLVGGGGDWMFVHFRPTLDELADVEVRLRDTALGELLRLEYDYLSVTEAGLYHATAEAAKESQPGTPAFRAAIEAAQQAEAASDHIRSRLYPQVPEGMRYVSFYPMSKRRGEKNNWYALPVDERSRLMREHGMTGRTFAGRIFQVITGSVGFDDWEWGVTLFARDPLEFKRIVTEMRYDEASALYGEFGRFFTGIRFAPADWPALLGAQGAGA
ncbi:MAG TPA: hydrogen peroxide-dependent heme synthase [Longimicrobium sp.]|nr:hydrogen peroxide-dependent heme synthase [Longimicrobium sp.]